MIEQLETAILKVHIGQALHACFVTDSAGRGIPVTRVALDVEKPATAPIVILHIPLYCCEVTVEPSKCQS